MKIIKRNGSEVPFDITKIITAVTKASDSVSRKSSLTQEQILSIANDVTEQCQALNRAVSVEEIQDMVENKLMDIQAHDVARHYITYRYVQSLKRQTNTTDERILSLIECQNEEVKQENANKNPTVNSVQRDYMAGEISKDLTARLLLDPEIVKAHNEGLIHFHDSDYFAQHMHNCDLVNLEDMLQNGTVISGTYIEKPHSFSTACNIATQIIAQVAFYQYGGQSISLTHLAPFVDVSRKKIAAEVELEMEPSVSQVVFELRQVGENSTRFILDRKAGELVFDRSRAGNIENGVRRCNFESAGENRVRIHAFLDSCSMEIFADDGRTVMTNNAVSAEGETRLSVTSLGGRTALSEFNTYGMDKVISW